MRDFTRLTTISPLTTIRRDRRLPGSGEVVARIGQQVSFRQVVARMPQKSNFYVLPISRMLRIPPEDLQEHLLVVEGTAVVQGTKLLEKRGLFGKPFVSPVDGEVFRIRNGRIVFQRTTDWIELRAMLAGRVVDQIQRNGVTIEVNGSLIQAVWSNGQEGFGKLKMVANTAGEPFSHCEFGDDTAGQILVTGTIDRLDTLRKAAGNEIGGLIAASMKAELCQATEALPYPVIVTDSIGEHPMAAPIFQLLKESEGREASLLGESDDNQAGRPEIIIPLTSTPSAEPPDVHKPMATGQIVRILRAPHKGHVGEVVRLYTHAQRTTIGTRVHGVDVKLPNGQVAFVPYANLDTIV